MPLDCWVSKTIPTSQEGKHHPRGTPHTTAGIENNTRHTRETHTNKHGYRKRYPTLKESTTPQTWVSKTIPTSQEEKHHPRGTPHANAGIENDTQP